MRDGTATRVTMNPAGQTVLRILIASYFIAVALGIISGTNLALLFSAVLPAPLDAAFAAGMVFILAFMVMLAVYTRVAALILALMTFYASYLMMVELGVEQELGSFWRDLALIAALLLTYFDHTPERGQHRRAIHRTIAPRRVAPMLERVAQSGLQHGADDTERSVQRLIPRRVSVPPMVRRLTVKVTRDLPNEVDNVFADAFDTPTDAQRDSTDFDGGQNA